jgi:nucleoside-diphosphate-sugar epimerase
MARFKEILMNRHDDVVIVTGSSGLIGSAVINRVAENFRIVGFDREGPPHPPPAADCVSVDLISDESVQRGLSRVRLEYSTFWPYEKKWPL